MAKKRRIQNPDGGFLKRAHVRPEDVADAEEYPYTIPAIRELGSLELHPHVTFLVGENGSGKSTLIEALAVAAGFNAEGGTKNYLFDTRTSHSPLSDAVQLVRGPNREQDGFFLRAETMYNTFSYMESINLPGYDYGSLHECSHGEAFMDVMRNRWKNGGLFLLDEPESALSPKRQFELLGLIHGQATELGSQFIIATHSPILMAYPHSLLYWLDETGIRSTDFRETEHFRFTKMFLDHHEQFFRTMEEANSDEVGR